MKHKHVKNLLSPMKGRPPPRWKDMVDPVRKGWRLFGGPVDEPVMKWKDPDWVLAKVRVRKRYSDGLGRFEKHIHRAEQA